MEEMLREAQRAGNPYDLVHFDGHGNFRPEQQIGELCFEKPDDGAVKSETDLVRADRLGDLLAKYKIPLVVLAACRSATVGETAVFQSIAPRLIKAGVGSVLSMGHAVHVEAARLLMDRFYRELACVATIGHAVAQARTSLVNSPYRWLEYKPGGRTIALADWFLPHLYQRGLDEPLLPPRDAAQQQPVRKFDVFLSHNHNDSARVVSLARALSEKHGIRVWYDKWETQMGDLEEHCAEGIRNSRFTFLAGSPDAFGSDWVQWEIEQTKLRDPKLRTLLAAKLKPCDLPAGLPKLYWVDMRLPENDEAGAKEIAELLIEADIRLGREFRSFRAPPEHGEPRAFPRPPQFQFQGRAKELYDLERCFRRQRGIVLHAMGGMGKTTLATEAANWWTRSGLFRDGACFVSFEQYTNAERVIAVLGEYCEGPKFHQRPASEQRKRAIEFFQQRAVLVVWDNYESVLPAFHQDQQAHDTPYTDDERSRLADLFRDLTTGPGKGCVLVTCRPGETGLPGAMKFELHGLARADSLWLLHRILERDGVKLSDPRLAREQLDPLLNDLADHPLSLELVGPHLRSLTPEQIRADFGKLLATTQPSDQERNTSLLASLEFSCRHLSPAARQALPWLGLFRGGVFEGVFLPLSQIEPAAWEAIRSELQGIALLRTEAELQIGKRPFLRFHPTLAIASADSALAKQPEIRERFLQVYFGLMQMLDKALFGAQSRAALAILDREEMNWRTAVHWAIADHRHPIAADLGHTFRNYLERSGRLRERDAWVRMLRDAVSQGDFTAEAADYEREHARTLFAQGEPQAAVDKLQTLIARLRKTTEFDPAFELAFAVAAFGDMLNDSGASSRAIPVLREAVVLWERLVERAGGKPWEALLASSDHAHAASQLGNLSATMGNLANALSSAGQHEDALDCAEKCVVIHQTCGHDREVAVDHGRCASMLMDMGRFDEADARYDIALAAAREAGDRELEGSLFQHQGILAYERNEADRATRLYQQALQRFQEASKSGAMMRTYNLLGVTEQNAGRLAEARAWYVKSRELAIGLKDQPGISQAAQNIGIVCQKEGEAARARGDEVAARRHFEEALRSVEDSLQVRQALQNRPNEADSLGQLARIHLHLGDLDAAERHVHSARQIYESLDLKEAWKIYGILSEIAVARGDTNAAAEWARKRDELLAEVKRRAGGGGGIPPEMLKALAQLTLACARAGFGGETLDPGAEEALATLDGLPAPFPAFSAHLRRLAAGELPPIPAGLPKELHEILEQIDQAIREAAKPS